LFAIYSFAFSHWPLAIGFFFFLFFIPLLLLGIVFNTYELEGEVSFLRFAANG
jgi:hypothetical protein